MFVILHDAKRKCLNIGLNVFRITLIIVLILIVLVAVFIIVLNLLQTNKPDFLPPVLRSWNFLPKFMRSLEPYDEVVSNFLCCKNYKNDKKVAPVENNYNDFDLNQEPKIVLPNNKSELEEENILVTSI